VVGLIGSSRGTDEGRAFLVETLTVGGCECMGPGAVVEGAVVVVLKRFREAFRAGRREDPATTI
jgi:hypothetical protein